jgi:voltage-gated potassium channel
MKSLGLVFNYLWRVQNRSSLRLFVRLLGVLVLMVTVYSVTFHWIMAREGQSYSWPTSVYWTLVTMSTLGFGDITFTSDLGRMFSVVVLLTGSIFILVLLPFTFIQFVFLPWMEGRASARAPRQVPEGTVDHVVFTRVSPIEETLIRRLRRAEVPYVVLEPELDEALRLHDQGISVMVGALDDPGTYRAARLADAAILATTRSDAVNTNITFTAREVCPEVKIVATATSAASVDILALAGADQVLQLGEMLGTSFAQRVLRPGSSAHVVGEFGPLLVAEATVAGTSLVGSTIGASRLREELAVSVVGAWDRGEFHTARPDTPITEHTVLVLAGTRDQIDAYDRAFASTVPAPHRVIIIGGGRVGRAVGRHVVASGIDHKIVEQQSGRVDDAEHLVLGDAADLEVLRRAGIDEADGVIITTHDDDTNVYLTLYCRRLRPEIQVLARANLDRNVSTLHRAGADVVLSYASAGATAIWNELQANDTLVLDEGLDVFEVDIPPALVGRTLQESAIRQRTGCHVVAVLGDDGSVTTPNAATVLPADGHLLLIGDADGEDLFLRFTWVPVRPADGAKGVQQR